MVTVDALNCQKQTVRIIIKQEVDYLFCAKDNQLLLKKDIGDYIQDQKLRKTINMFSDRKELWTDRKGTAYVTPDSSWLEHRETGRS